MRAFVWLFILMTCFSNIAWGGTSEPGEETVTLHEGEEAALFGGELRVQFVGVTQDSRCPQGAQCIWAGNARVELRLQNHNGSSLVLSVNSRLEPKVVDFGPYHARLIELSPYPRLNAPPAPKGYQATIAVSR